MRKGDLEMQGEGQAGKGKTQRAVCTYHPEDEWNFTYCSHVLIRLKFKKTKEGFSSLYHISGFLIVHNLNVIWDWPSESGLLKQTTLGSFSLLPKSLLYIQSDRGFVCVCACIVVSSYFSLAYFFFPCFWMILAFLTGYFDTCSQNQFVTCFLLTKLRSYIFNEKNHRK